MKIKNGYSIHYFSLYFHFLAQFFFTTFFFFLPMISLSFFFSNTIVYPLSHSPHFSFTTFLLHLLHYFLTPLSPSTFLLNFLFPFSQFISHPTFSFTILTPFYHPLSLQFCFVLSHLTSSVRSVLQFLIYLSKPILYTLEGRNHGLDNHSFLRTWIAKLKD